MNPGAKLVLKSALAAFAAGFVAAGAAYFMDPGHYSLDHLKAFVPVGVASGFAGLYLYLKQSPVSRWLYERAGGVDQRGKTAESLKVTDVLPIVGKSKGDV